MLGDYAIIGPPDLTRERFAAILSAANSPAAPEADDMYAALVAANVSPAAFLAFFLVESRMGTVGVTPEFGTRNPGNVRSAEIPALSTGVVQTPRGQFARYPTWANGAADWAARMIGPKYRGSGLFTVRSVIPKYAPGSDGNVPEAYIASVLKSIEGWTGGVIGMPLTIREAIIPLQANRPGTKLEGGRPGGITMHETANTNPGANAEMHRRFVANGGGPENVSFHYVVDDKEAIHLLPNDEEGHHAGDGLGPGSCGSTTLGIELCVNSDGDWARTRANGAELVALLLTKHGLTAATVRQHFDCSGKNCPTKMRANNNAQWSGFMAGVNAAYALLNPPSGGGGGEDDMDGYAANTITPVINSRGEALVVINYGGVVASNEGVNIVDAGSSWKNAAGEVYDRSVQSNAFKDWQGPR
jgi:N-acetylmuramoyl-L-alanine amidase